jgi:hypothetical protein
MDTDLRVAPGTRSRRALLAGAAGGLLAAAAGALGRPAPAVASHLLGFGHANNAGAANTTLTTSSTGTALLVTQNGTGTALRGSAVGPGSIAGFFTATNGIGISGVTGNATKFGVYAGNDAPTYADGAAIRANGQQNYGVLATAAGEDADAVRALHSGAGTAVFAKSQNGEGVQAVSTSGIGVSASTSAGDAAGIQGGNLASSGGIGVRGGAFALTGTPYGVFGEAPTNGYAGYFDGNAHVTGTLSKAAGAFKIDHPLDPANRYLSHSFVESPDMLNVYNGNATTDDDGSAIVALPAWFEALNRDFRYQLTVIGQPAQAFVATKVKDNHFTIATDRPDVEVSWQVTGIRKDRYADAHRIPVDEPKPANERGTYLHPREHGHPVAKGLDAKRMRPKTP